MPLPLITVQTFNQSSLQAAGAVFVQRVESVSVSRGLLAGITGAPSGTGRNELMEKKMNDLTQVLLSELDIQAKKKYKYCYHKLQRTNHCRRYHNENRSDMLAVLHS
jgi:hypothetical protein